MSRNDIRPSEVLAGGFARPIDRRSLLLGTAGAGALAALAGNHLALRRAVAQAEPGGDLVIAFNADPEILDPHVTTALLASRCLALMHDSLITRDYDGVFQPGLADEWTISEDGLTYTFNLKSGVAFHSGKAFTSADVKYTFERWLSTEASPTSYTIEPIASIDAPDELTVVFTLSTPYNIFLDQLSGAWAVIVNQEAVEAAGDQYGVSAVDGTGPFSFVEWTRNQSLRMAQNPNYTWGAPIFENAGPAHVDTIEIRVVPEDTTRIAEFQAGNIHLVQDVPGVDVERLRQEPGIEIVEYAQLQTTYLGMNTTKPPVDDVRVRQAISYGLNREEIVQGANFGLGTPAVTMLHPETPFYWAGAADIAPSYDPERAMALLDEAGWVAGDGDVRTKDGQDLVLPLWVINDSTTVLQAQIIEQQLAAIGIRVETTQYEQTAWFEAARSGEQVGYIIGVFYENADVLYFYFFSEQQPAPNRFFYNVPEMDQWLLDSRSNPDQAAVQTDYENIQRRLIEDAPAAPLIHTLGTLGRRDVVQGVRVHPSRWLYRGLDLSLSE
jgi:peptide/nickel transport system substrate-binding protein